MRLGSGPAASLVTHNKLLSVPLLIAINLNCIRLFTITSSRSQCVCFFFRSLLFWLFLFISISSMPPIISQFFFFLRPTICFSALEEKKKNKEIWFRLIDLWHDRIWIVCKCCSVCATKDEWHAINPIPKKLLPYFSDPFGYKFFMIAAIFSQLCRFTQTEHVFNEGWPLDFDYTLSLPYPINWVYRQMSRFAIIIYVILVYQIVICRITPFWRRAEKKDKCEPNKINFI